MVCSGDSYVGGQSPYRVSDKCGWNQVLSEIHRRCFRFPGSCPLCGATYERCLAGNHPGRTAWGLSQLIALELIAR